jgi:hypothetical protein
MFKIHVTFLQDVYILWTTQSLLYAAFEKIYKILLEIHVGLLYLRIGTKIKFAQIVLHITNIKFY